MSKLIIAIVLAVLVSLFVARVVLAQEPDQVQDRRPEPELVVGFEANGTVGERVALSAYLVDPAGNPIRGQTVTFLLDVKFMNVITSIELGQDVTDETGLALILNTPRTSGEVTIRARFEGNDVFAEASSFDVITVAEGDPVFEQIEPFRIPGANVSLVVAVLVIIWTTYLGVVGLFFRISRQGESGEEVGR